MCNINSIVTGFSPPPFETKKHIDTAVDCWVVPEEKDNFSMKPDEWQVGQLSQSEYNSAQKTHDAQTGRQILDDFHFRN